MFLISPTCHLPGSLTVGFPGSGWGPACCWRQRLFSTSPHQGAWSCQLLQPAREQGCLVAAGATELVTNQLSTSTRRCLKENINILSSELPRCLKEGGGGAAVQARLAKRARALRCCPSVPRPLRVFICRVNKMVANKVRFQRKRALEGSRKRASKHEALAAGASLIGLACFMRQVLC